MSSAVPHNLENLLSLLSSYLKRNPTRAVQKEEKLYGPPRGAARTVREGEKPSDPREKGRSYAGSSQSTKSPQVLLLANFFHTSTGIRLEACEKKKKTACTAAPVPYAEEKAKQPKGKGWKSTPSSSLRRKPTKPPPTLLQT
jgi:hypothetical protein